MKYSPRFLCALILGMLSVVGMDAQTFIPTIQKPNLYPPISVTDTSFTASWTPIPDIGMYVLSVGVEQTFAQAGVHAVAEPIIKGSGKDTPEYLGFLVPLDPYFSQAGWMGRGPSLWKNGISLSQLDASIPEEMISSVKLIASPRMTLNANGGKFRLKIKARGNKAGSTEGVKVFIQSYAYFASKPAGIRIEPIISELKEYVFDFANGSSNSVVSIALGEKGQVDIESIRIEQELVEGAKIFREEAYRQFSGDNIGRVITPDGEVDTVHIGQDLNPSILDLADAKAKGEKVAYRMMVLRPDPLDETKVYISLPSNLSYFQEDVIEDPNYYLGYCAYQAPNYAQGALGNTDGSFYTVAVKLTKEKTAQLIGAKVVGLRFCVNASRQTGGVFAEGSGMGGFKPMIFVSENIRPFYSSLEPPEGSPTTFVMQKGVSKFEDGWNTVMFDTPYPIEDKDFYVGYELYSERGGFPICIQTEGETASVPNSYFERNYPAQYWPNATESNGFEYGFRDFAKWGNAPVLIQAIVEGANIEALKNKAALTAASLEKYVYTNEQAKMTVALRNTGANNIQKVEFEVGFPGQLTKKVYTFPIRLKPNNTTVIEISDISVPQTPGEATATVSVVAVNDKPFAGEKVSVSTTVIDNTKVFPRKALLELFSSESCQYCPMGDARVLSAVESTQLFNDNTIIVIHHEGQGKDFLTMAASSALLPMFGYGENVQTGQISPKRYSPAMMLNRMVNKALDSEFPVASVPNTKDIVKALTEAIERNPAYAKVDISSKYDEATNKLTITIKGQLSDARDMSRPVYLSIYIRQSHIPNKNQQFFGDPIQGYKHDYALRYVLSQNNQLEIKPNADGSFEVTKEIVPEGVDTWNVSDNKLVLLSGKQDNKGNPIEPLSISEALSNCHVVAFAHHYAQLPSPEATSPSDALLHNEVLNADMAPAKGKTIGITETVGRPDLYVYTVGNDLYVGGGEYTSLRVYTLDGITTSPKSMVPGIYVVSITRIDGSIKNTKVVIP